MEYCTNIVLMLKEKKKKKNTKKTHKNKLYFLNKQCFMMKVSNGFGEIRHFSAPKKREKKISCGYIFTLEEEEFTIEIQKWRERNQT